MALPARSNRNHVTTPMSSADASLRLFASRRNEDAFRELTRQTTPALYRFLARLLGGGDTALLEELAQRTYIVVARKASLYRGPSATSWILGIAFREVRSHRREICRQRAREAPRGAAPLEMERTFEGGDVEVEWAAPAAGQ